MNENQLAWSRSVDFRDNHKAVVTTTIRLRFDYNSTALRPFDDLLYDRAAALRPK